MPRRCWPSLLFLILTLGATPAARAQSPAEDAYTRTIKPLLERRCFACHGVLEQKAKLRLDTVALMKQGGQTGPVIEAGHADESFLIDRVTETDPALRMPPEGEPLKAAEIAAIRAWIDAGAPAPADESTQADPADHWAFRPPVRPIPPDSSPAATHPVDAFIDAELERRGITPAPEADRATLLRRVTLDLTGLAPTPRELEAFAVDPRPDAYERLVDRLLASPRYAARWARHWMDVWRYSDWYGFGAEVRQSRPHIWQWRDWIIESLAADRPYDRMIQEMLAGDELAPADPDTLRATGYLARSWHKFNRSVWLHDTVDHVGKAFLGVTLECAKCHDHKYDPIKQTDYYRFRAFFEPLDVREDEEPGRAALVRIFDAKLDAPTHRFERGDDRKPDTSKSLAPGVPRLLADWLEAPRPIVLAHVESYPGLRPEARARALEAARKRVADARSELEKARARRDAAHAATVGGDAALDRGAGDRARLEARLMDGLVTGREKVLLGAQAELAAVEARLAADAARYLAPPDSKRDLFLTIRAGLLERQARLAVAAGWLADSRALLELQEQSPEGDAGSEERKKKREQLAAQVADAVKRKAEAEAEAAKPLPHSYAPFGPVYPEHSSGRRLALARWITDPRNPLTARVAVNHVWLRHMGRPLVETVFDFGHHGQPPSHPELLDWLALDLVEHGWSLRHLHRRIVTSAAYRRTSRVAADQPALALDAANRLYARGQPRRMEAELVRDNVLWISGGLDETPGGPELDPANVLELPRRSLYFRHAPEKQAEFLKLFDAANPAACYRREMSIMPQQSLALANSPLTLEACRRLAAALSREAGADDAAFIDRAFLRILARWPAPAEHSACRQHLDRLASGLADSSGWSAFAEGPAPRTPPAAEPRRRAREALLHVLFNHHDFVTIR